MPLESLLPLLLDLLVKSFAVLLLAAGAAFVFRRASAANRHMIWLAAFLALLLLPFTKLARPLWSYQWKDHAPLAAQAGPAQIVVRTVLPAAPIGRASAAPAESQPSWPGAVNWPAVVVMLWLAGGLLMVAHRGAVSWRVRRLVRGSQTLADNRVLVSWRALTTEAGLRAHLRISDQCRVPMVVGVWRPVVLLPLQALDWTDARLAAALRHELGHLRRGDCFARLLADGLCALYWMNPLMWFAAREMRVAQEQACDDLVLGSGADAMDYASQLVDIVRSLGGDRVSTRHALAMAQPSTLETRVRSIVDQARDRRPLSYRMAVGGAASVLAAVALCGMAQLSGAAETKNPAASTPATGVPPDDKERMVHIISRFIELSGDLALPPILSRLPKGRDADSLHGSFITWSGPQMQVGIRALAQMKGVDMLSLPSVSTKSSQGATVEVVYDFKHPIEGKPRMITTTTSGHWEKDAKTGGKPKLLLKTRGVGAALGVVPTIQENGMIELTLAPEVVEFEGFFDLDAVGKSIPGTEGASKSLRNSSKGPMVGGHRVTPIFSVRKFDAVVSILPGRTVVMACGPARLETGDGDGIDVTLPLHGRPYRHLLVFVTAELVKAKADKMEGPPKAESATLGGPKQPNFVEDWEVKGLSHHNGEPQVLLSNHKTLEQRWVKTTGDKDGFKLLKVDVDKNGHGLVEVSKTGEAETATFTLPPKSVGPRTEPVSKPAPSPTLAPVTHLASGDEDLVSIGFRSVPMPQILEFYEGLTGKKVIHDSDVEAVTFSLETARAMPKTKAIEFMEQSLRLNGYGFVPAADGVVKFIKLADCFTIFGKVNRQGKYEIATTGTHLAQAIQMAGGFAPSADPGQMKIVRQGPDGKTTIIIKAGDDPVLQANDVIIVGEK